MLHSNLDILLIMRWKLPWKQFGILPEYEVAKRGNQSLNHMSTIENIWKYWQKNNLQSLIVFISLVHWHMSSVHAIFVNILRHFASFRLALQGTPSRILRSCQKYRPKAGEVHHDKPGIQNSRSQVVLTWNFRRCQADFRRKQYPFRAIGKFYSQDIRTKTG